MTHPTRDDISITSGICFLCITYHHHHHHRQPGSYQLNGACTSPAYRGIAKCSLSAHGIMTSMVLVWLITQPATRQTHKSDKDADMLIIAALRSSRFISSICILTSLWAWSEFSIHWARIIDCNDQETLSGLDFIWSE